MELKEYLLIIKKYQNIFWFVWLTICFLGLFTLAVQPTTYRGEMTLLVGRETKGDSRNKTVVTEKAGREFLTENNQAGSGDFDYYYRLEANKSIAKILVASLKDRAFLREVALTSEKKKKLSAEERWMLRKIKGEVLGAGYVKITIKAHRKEKIKRLADTLTDKLSKKIASVGASDETKIILISEPPLVELSPKPYKPVSLAVFFGGLLLAIFIVLFKYYWDEEK
jgi:capsular polysaccharide biosynthesis protein